MNETSLHAIAELIHDQLSPGETDEPRVELENILEEVKNSYVFLVWKLYMRNQGENERAAYEGLLRRKRFPVPVHDGPIILEGINLISTPRDEAMVQVIPVNGKNRAAGEPLEKTNSALAYMPSRIDEGFSFYRLENELYTPDGLPDGTVEVEVVYMGIPEDDHLLVSRDVADMVRQDVWNKLKEGVGIPVDETNNSEANG